MAFVVAHVEDELPGPLRRLEPLVDDVIASFVVQCRGDRGDVRHRSAALQYPPAASVVADHLGEPAHYEPFDFARGGCRFPDTRIRIYGSGYFVCEATHHRTRTVDETEISGRTELCAVRKYFVPDFSDYPNGILRLHG